MFQLSEQQTGIIYERLHKPGLRSVKLEEDLFDHFCCYVEEEMERGADFESAYRNAVDAISPNGIKEIEFELFFIMNFNKQLSMKRFVFLGGFAAAFLLSTATMFRTLRWPGANVMLFAGFAILLLTVIAGIIYLARFLRSRSRLFWFRTAAGLLAPALIAMGFIFRILHIPGANVLYGLGTIVLNFIFLPLFFLHVYRYGFGRVGEEERRSV